MFKKVRMYSETIAGIVIGTIGVYQVTCWFASVQPTVIGGFLCAAFGLGLILLGATEKSYDNYSRKLNGQ